MWNDKASKTPFVSQLARSPLLFIKAMFGLMEYDGVGWNGVVTN